MRATEANGRRPPAARGDAGQSIVGTTVGVLVFLLFLLFACQLLIGLYARSVVSGAAFDGARLIARRPGNVYAAKAEADQQVATELGGMTVLFTGTAFDPNGADPDYIEYTVRASAPRFMTGFMSDTIERTSRVRVEKLQ